MPISATTAKALADVLTVPVSIIGDIEDDLYEAGEMDLAVAANDANVALDKIRFLLFAHPGRKFDTEPVEDAVNDPAAAKTDDLTQEERQPCTNTA